MGKGIIEITMELLPSLLERALMLPDGMTIEAASATYYFDRNVWLFRVEDEHIPPTEKGKKLPYVDLNYERLEDGSVILAGWTTKRR